jgi:hypothetical protein
MAIIRKRKWLWLSPAKLHTFKVKAWSRTTESEWATVTLNLSNAPDFEWDATAGLMARPIWWRRSIRVVWTAFPFRYRKWFDHYIIFRKDVTPPDANDFEEAATNKEDSEFFIANTFERYAWLGQDDVKEDNDFRNQYSAWNHYYFDENIELETTYYYWVHAVNQHGELSQQYLGPDSALWGKPQTPVLQPGWFSTQVHEINKWSCDVLAWWDSRPDGTKPGGAEYYIIQRRQKRDRLALPEAIWGESIRIDHDYEEELDPNKEANDGRYQAGVVHNFWVDKNYEFRIKAVNIPGVGKLGLESAWTQPPYPTYKTLHDTEAPPEVTGVAANRFWWQGVQRGDYIRLKWDRFWQNDDSGVRAPILTEQLVHYNIYRYKGTDANAALEADAVNLHAGYSNDGGTNDDSVYGSGEYEGEYIVRKKVYKQTGKFEGTQFVDDDVESTASETEEAEVWDLVWTCEGANDTERSTATISGDTLAGTPAGNYLFDSSDKYAGTYSFASTAVSGAITWNTGAEFTFSGDEGFIEFYFKGDVDSPSLSYLLEWYYSPFNRIFCYWDSGLTVYRRGASRIHTVTVPDSEFTGDNDPRTGWARFQIRWSVTNNKLQVRVGEGTWYDASYAGGELLAFANTPTYFSVAAYTCVGHHIDNVSLSLTYEVPVVSLAVYYHYWVTAVDSYGYESNVTMVDSYDKVSFLPPPNVSGLDNRQELVNNHTTFRMYSLKVLWDIIDEATHYQVRIKVKPPGKIFGVERNYGFWHYSALLREERFYDEDDEGKASYTYPLPLVYGTKVKFAVIAWNRAGKSPEWTESEEITIERDDSAPGNVKDFKGDCIGVNNLYTGIQQWNAINVSFQPRPHSDGIKCYIVEIKNLSSEWEYLDEFSPKLGLDSDRFASVRVKYTIPARVLPEWVQDRDYIELRIYAIDSDNHPSLNLPEDPWPEATVNWERWWQF